MTPTVPVLSAAEAAALDAATIAAGVPSRALMQRAGGAAAAEIARRFGDALASGVLVCAGPGNNGGDAWVVARALHAAGVPCTVHEPMPARTDDARAERALALAAGIAIVDASARSALAAGASAPATIIDGLLGIGASGPPRGEIAAAVTEIAVRRALGARVVALDVPSGLDADTGATDGAVVADLTVTFGALKRGLLVSRAHAGRIAVVDVGFVAPADAATLPVLVGARWVGARIPTIVPDAHKGMRRKLAVLGGAPGMAGAAVLAGRAAIASGIGMVKLVVHTDSLAPVQAALPEALAMPWPVDDAEFDARVGEWADALVVGPGLGRDEAAGVLLARALERWRGPVVLDADAFAPYAGRAGDLGALLDGRRALLTPHPAEFARLAGRALVDVLAHRFDVGAELARLVRATVLLKGTPTVVAAPDGRRLVSASGSAVLAAAGSGDILAGIAGTLLAQMDDAADAGAYAAWTHGHAAQIADGFGARGVRGVTLADVVDALGDAWQARPDALGYPTIADLPAPHAVG